MTDERPETEAGPAGEPVDRATTPATPATPATETRQEPQPGADSPEKPVDEWVTGDEPMTGPQRSYLHTLAREAGEDVPEPEPTKADASILIERLQRATGRIPADRDR